MANFNLNFGNNQELPIGLILLIFGIVINLGYIPVMLSKRGATKILVILPLLALTGIILYAFPINIKSYDLDKDDVEFYSLGVAIGTTIFTVLISAITR